MPSHGGGSPSAEELYRVGPAVPHDSQPGTAVPHASRRVS